MNQQHLVEAIKRVIDEVELQRLQAECEFGFQPYGVAMHPDTAQMLRAIRDWFATETRTISPGRPEYFLGLLICEDSGIERGAVEVLSEEAAKKRYA